MVLSGSEDLQSVLEPLYNTMEIFDFFRKYYKIRFSRQKLLIYSDFWANYSISFQKSPLSNILPVHDNIMLIFHDPSTTPLLPPATPYTPLPKIGGSRPPTPQDSPT